MDTQIVRFFSRKLSATMANDGEFSNLQLTKFDLSQMVFVSLPLASVKTAVLDELAEKHSTAFLDHAVTENLCSTVCDRLMSSSPSSLAEYVGDKMNANEEFAASILNRIGLNTLQNRILSASSPDEKRQLLNDIAAQLDATDGSDAATINKLLMKIFTNFDFTPEQFHEFMKLHILKAVRGHACSDAPSSSV